MRLTEKCSTLFEHSHLLLTRNVTIMVIVTIMKTMKKFVYPAVNCFRESFYYKIQWKINCIPGHPELTINWKYITAACRLKKTHNNNWRWKNKSFINWIYLSIFFEIELTCCFSYSLNNHINKYLSMMCI